MRPIDDDDDDGTRMPKVSKRPRLLATEAAAAAEDESLRRPASRASLPSLGALERRHKLEWREVRQRIARLQLQRSGLSRSNLSENEMRKWLTDQARAIESEFRERCDREMAEARSRLPSEGGSAIARPPIGKSQRRANRRLEQALAAEGSGSIPHSLHDSLLVESVPGQPMRISGPTTASVVAPVPEATTAVADLRRVADDDDDDDDVGEVLKRS